MNDKSNIVMNNQDYITFQSRINNESYLYSRKSYENEIDTDSDLYIEMQIKTIEMLALIKGTSPQEAYNKMEQDSYNNRFEDNENDNYFFFDDDDSLFEPILYNIDSDKESEIIEYLNNLEDVDEEIFEMDL